MKAFLIDAMKQRLYKSDLPFFIYMNINLQLKMKMKTKKETFTRHLYT